MINIPLIVSPPPAQRHNKPKPEPPMHRSPVGICDRKWLALTQLTIATINKCAERQAVCSTSGHEHWEIEDRLTPSIIKTCMS
jgi:hypothetical protein